MGGSQGASGINELVLQSLPLLASRAPEWQWFHLTGPGDAEKVSQAYAALKLKAVVHPFFAEMELALGAATVAVCRAGASSLAELAAMRVPAVLVPYPAATDNHQFHNARAFEATGAARLLEQKSATPETLVQLLLDLIEKPAVHEKMQSALAQWHAPHAAEQIAEAMLAPAGAGAGEGCRADSPSGRITEPPGLRIPGTIRSLPDRRRPADCRSALPAGYRTRAAGREGRMNRHDAILEKAVPSGAEAADELAQRVSPATVIRRDEPLAKHTTLRVGGPADIYVEPASEEDLAAVLAYCRERSWPFFVLGRGSNLLVKDGGFRGVVICLAHAAFQPDRSGGRASALRRGRETESGRGRSQAKRSGRAGISGRHSRQRRRRVAHERRGDGRRDVRRGRVRSPDGVSTGRCTSGRPGS